MIGILGVVLLATNCLSTEPSSVTNIESNGIESSRLYGLKEIIKNLGIDVDKIKEISKLPNDPELIALAKSTTVIVFLHRAYSLNE